MNFTICMTSCPRMDVPRQAAVRYLRDGGFDDEVHCFVEPGATQKISGVTYHVNQSKLGGWENHKQAMRWAVENAKTQYVLLVEDDVRYRSDARIRVLDLLESQDRLSLATLYYSKRDSVEVPMQYADGWTLFNRGKLHYGNLALLFDRKLGLEPYISWVDKVFRKKGAFYSYDTVLFSWFLEHPEHNHGVWTHIPSLTDHIGGQSTLDHYDNEFRRGYRFIT